jgi:hypothetical protein
VPGGIDPAAAALLGLLVAANTKPFAPAALTGLLTAVGGMHDQLDPRASRGPAQVRVTSTTLLTGALLSVPRRLARQHYNQ